VACPIGNCEPKEERGNVDMRKLIFKIKMAIAKFKYPNAGYWERVCLVNGFTKKDIDEWVEQAIKDGWIERNDKCGREEVCETEVSYWN
jgi:hypothetical protein